MTTGAARGDRAVSPAARRIAAASPRGHPGARAPAWAKIALAAGSLVLTCLVLEIGLRFFHPVELHPIDAFLTLPAADDPEAGKPSLVARSVARQRTDEFDFTVRINSRGLRDSEFASRKPPGTYRVLVLGDSHTFGWGVDLEATYAKLLEQRLRRDLAGRAFRHVEVINAAVPAMGTAHQLFFLEDEGFAYQPDAVLLGFFFNDVNDNADNKLYALEGDRLVRRVPRERVGFPFPVRDGRSQKSVFRSQNGIGRRPAERLNSRTAEYPERAGPAIAEGAGPAIAEGAGPAIPERAGPAIPEGTQSGPSFWVRHSHLVRFVREKASRSWQTHHASLDSGPWTMDHGPSSSVHRPSSALTRGSARVRLPEARALTAHLLDRMARACERRRILFLVALIPAQVDCAKPPGSKLAEAHAESLRFLPTSQVVDLLPRFQAAGCDAMFFRKDGHISAAGHRAAAEAIAARLLPRVRDRVRTRGRA